MARERISLVPEEVKTEKQLRSMIETGEITAENFYTLPQEEQRKVKDILFEIAASQINLAQGVSAIEFVLLSYIRIMNKKVNGLALSAEEKMIEEKLEKIYEAHEITNESVSIHDWLFDYLDYAYNTTLQVMKNRKEHISRKKKVTGSR